MMKKVKKIIGYLCFVICICFILYICISRMMGKQPTLFGYQFNVVVTPSMTPTLNVGDVIVSKNYQGQKLNEGDIITYLKKGGDMSGKLITHRIISIIDDDGEIKIITRGDASATDDDPISSSQIISIYKFKSTIISFIYRFITTTIGFICVIVIPIAGLIIYELIAIFKSVKGKEEDESEEK